jgi:hypothetical protein
MPEQSHVGVTNSESGCDGHSACRVFLSAPNASLISTFGTASGAIACSKLKNSAMSGCVAFAIAENEATLLLVRPINKRATARDGDNETRPAIEERQEGAESIAQKERRPT